MVDIGLWVYYCVRMIFSILIIWIVTKNMINTKNIILFLPLFFVGIIWIFGLVFVLEGVYNKWIWGIFEVLTSLSLLMFFVVIRRNCKWI